MRPRRDRMGPFHIQRNLQRPSGIGARPGSGGGFGQNEIAVGILGGQMKHLAEDAQIVSDVGRIVSIDNGDGLACAVGVDAVIAAGDHDMIQAVGVANFPRRHSRRQ